MTTPGTWLFRGGSRACCRLLQPWGSPVWDAAHAALSPPAVPPFHALHNRPPETVFGVPGVAQVWGRVDPCPHTLGHQAVHN